MPKLVSWSLNVEISGGPKESIPKTLNLDAYDVIQVTIAKHATDAVEVPVQPNDDGVQLLLVQSSLYDDKLTYSVNAAESVVSKRHKLDQPLMLVGEGAVKLLGATPKRFFIYNQNDQDKEAAISILVGRNVT